MSSDNLLIGNGLNMDLDYSLFCATSIEKRFYRVLINTSLLYEALFGFRISTDVCIRLSEQSREKNIEQLADDLFGLVKAHCVKSGVVDSRNLTERINAAVKISALNAIFFDSTTPIHLELPEEKEQTLVKYKQILTLNYFEFWDRKQTRCTYLHGKMSTDMLPCDIGEVILYDEMRFHASQGSGTINDRAYAKAVECLKKRYMVIPVFESPIIFSPAQINKNKMANVTAYPSENLFPSWDLVPKKEINLYKELVGINDIVIFGVSPYGDDTLIDSLLQIQNIHIFVHDLSSRKGQAEQKTWSRKHKVNSLLFKMLRNFGDRVSCL